MESDETPDAKPTASSILTRVCLVGPVAENEELKKKLSDLNFPFVESKTGDEFAGEDSLEYETVFVLNEFEGEIFHKLKSSQNRILSEHVINYVFYTNKSIPYFQRPLYCTCMVGVNICFTNFKTKEHMTRLVALCHYMGAGIRRDVSSKVDVLVAYSTGGSKYQTAINLGKVVLKEDWVHQCWSERNREVPFEAKTDEFCLPHKFKPFEGCVLSFFGFPDSEKEHMTEQAKTQGASVIDEIDSTCTHLVIEQNCTQQLPATPSTVYVVLQEWFWGSIQIDGRAKESMYLYKSKDQNQMNTRSSTSSLLGTPRLRLDTSSASSTVRCSSGKNARKRLRDELNRFSSQNDQNSPRGHKRPSTDVSQCISETMLDVSNTSNIFAQSPINVATPGFWEVKKSTVPMRASDRNRNLRMRRKRKSSGDELDEEEEEKDSSVVSRRDQQKQKQQHSAGMSLRRSGSRKVGAGNRRSEVFLRPKSLLEELREEEEVEKKVAGGGENKHRRGAKHIKIFHDQLGEGDGEDVADSSPSGSATGDERVDSHRATARFHVSNELLQTEKNYVEILYTILKVFKEPLEKADQPGGPLLASEDVKRIFNPLPEIEAAHRSMSAELDELVAKWNPNTTCIGDVVSKYASEFQRHYPPFVNFFEERVNIISSCEASSSRFHAFLKINQAKPECGRQTLAELLINPVQRLPRIILLLQDIKKHTERENPKHPDVASIENAIKLFKQVTAHINENKRKTEEQHQLFSVVYEIQDCPPTLLSSERQYVGRVEAIATDDNLCRKGDHMSLYIFADCIEIAKTNRRGKYNTIKSPSLAARQPVPTRASKHIKLLSLSHIHHIFDYNETADCQQRIGLGTFTLEDGANQLYTFKIVSCQENNSASNQNELRPDGNGFDRSVGKEKIIQLLMKYHANTMCKAAVDADFVSKVDVHRHEFDSSSLAKSDKKVSKFSKLKHAFSFNKTPKRVIQRAHVNTPSSLGVDKISLKYDDGEDDDERMSTTASGFEQASSSSSSTLTPSISVTSLCPPSSRRHDQQYGDASNTTGGKEKSSSSSSSKLRPAYSTMSLARGVTSRNADFPAVPTPPRSRRRVTNAVRNALSRTASLRRRNNSKLETIV